MRNSRASKNLLLLVHLLLLPPNWVSYFDNNLSSTKHLFSVTESSLYHIRDLKRIRYTLDHSTVCIIARAYFSYSFRK